MKTVARCPSDRSRRDGTGIASLEAKGDRETDKGRENHQKMGKQAEHGATKTTEAVLAYV